MVMALDSVPVGEARRLGQEARHDTLAARNSRLDPGDRVRVSVLRSGNGSEGDGVETYEVPYQESMRVLDALIWISENAAPDLAYRWYCGSKMCGTCGVRMNGREVLACWEAVEPEMTIEPLRNLDVVRDLVVDRKRYDDRVARFEPWIERNASYEGFPEPLNHRDMANASKALDCIGCMCCYSACPVVGLGDLTDFAGPAPLVQLGQSALDPRNAAEKVERSLSVAGIFNCISCYKCEEVCPARIPIVSGVIEPLKYKAAQLDLPGASHARTLRDEVARRGRIDPSALVLRVRGLRALRNVARIWLLLRRGKINPFRTLWPARNAAMSAARRILRGR